MDKLQPLAFLVVSPLVIDIGARVVPFRSWYCWVFHYGTFPLIVGIGGFSTFCFKFFKFTTDTTRFNHAPIGLDEESIGLIAEVLEECSYTKLKAIE